MVTLPDHAIPMTGLRDFIAALAAQHGAVYECNGSSALVQAITRLAGDEAAPDATERLVIALRRANVIDGATMVTLLGRYFDEEKGSPGATINT